MKIDYWRATREWEGKTSVIVGGGPSVLTQDINLLRGRRVIAINSSYTAVPWADFVIFADSRWYEVHRKALDTFAGRIACASSISRGPRLLRLHRAKPPGLAADPGTVTIKFTTMTAAINLAAHLGSDRIVLTGADGKVATDGRCHHHAPHPWKYLPGCWSKQKQDLASLVDPLRKLEIDVVNASPGSALDLWPVMTLQEAIAWSETGSRLSSAECMASATTCISAPCCAS
jgi:hypothetical protein